MGVSLNIAAEVLNADMQLSLVASGLGLGILPPRVYATARRRGAIERVRVDLGVTASIVLHRASHLGPLRAAADCFEQDLRARFNQAHR
jgi:DNA-binding transcriptional LysR family regulator